MGFPLRDKITGGYPNIMKFTFFVILTQNETAIPVHFNFFQSVLIVNLHHYTEIVCKMGFTRGQL